MFDPQKWGPSFEKEIPNAVKNGVIGLFSTLRFFVPSASAFASAVAFSNSFLWGSTLSPLGTHVATPWPFVWNMWARSLLVDATVKTISQKRHFTVFFPSSA
eukprot:TRINITY_DN2295_c0_g2_i10.p2 TRINITY_DN2295_c0_g2~~TRINITY_DN2295_c0_g2_i10.p2  ORF type:complete len:102 (+),score=6.07 TRINITY_DN2295_c0_g2_i10:235-540(+)